MGSKLQVLAMSGRNLQVQVGAPGEKAAVLSSSMWQVEVVLPIRSSVGAQE